MWMMQGRNSMVPMKLEEGEIMCFRILEGGSEMEAAVVIEGCFWQSEAMDLVDGREQSEAAVVVGLQVTSAGGFNPGGSIDGRGLQVALRWIYEQGVIPVVKSFNKERMRQNLNIFSWELTADEASRIEQISPASRVV
ncbi:NAD(P)H-dependent 6'-deoxychalcone synthase [Linum grandiflorum]